MGLSPAVLNQLLVTDRPDASDGTITELTDEPTPFEFEFEVDSPTVTVGAAPSPKEVHLDPVFDDDLPEMQQPQPHRFRVRMLSESGATSHSGSPISPSPLSVTEMLRSRGDTPPINGNAQGTKDGDRRVVKRGLSDGVTAEYVFAGGYLTLSS